MLNLQEIRENREVASLLREMRGPQRNKSGFCEMQKWSFWV